MLQKHLVALGHLRSDERTLPQATALLVDRAERLPRGYEDLRGARRFHTVVDTPYISCERVGSVDEHDLALRSSTYGLFVELGRSPTASEVADAGGLPGPRS